MISTKTVFVLGAGASNPYGLPLGGELSDYVRNIYPHLEGADGLNALGKHFDIDEAELREFATQFARSGIDSVDRFLERRPVYANAGKLSIARELVRREVRATLLSRPESDWYSYLWNRMIVGASTVDALRRNNVKALTFNYDRSLEAYLDYAIRASYGDESLRYADFCPILHLYGDLGVYSRTSLANARGYDAVLDVPTLRLAINRLRIIPDERLDPDPFETGKRWLGEAEQVIFLGFAFDETNCERLGLLSLLMDTGRVALRQRIYATTLGLTDMQARSAELRVCPAPAWHAENCDALSALRRWDNLA